MLLTLAQWWSLFGYGNDDLNTEEDSSFNESPSMNPGTLAHADTATLLLALQALFLIFASFLAWWVRDLIGQFRAHCVASDAQQNLLTMQVAEARASFAFLQRSVQDLQEEVRGMRREHRPNNGG
jgi:hypothetical protein